MSTVTIEEKCPCGASINVTGSQYRRDHDARNPRGAEETVERWREQHNHQEPEAGPSARKEESRREMAERAWDEGHEAGFLQGRWDEYASSPYGRIEHT